MEPRERNKQKGGKSIAPEIHTFGNVSLEDI